MQFDKLVENCSMICCKTYDCLVETVQSCPLPSGAKSLKGKRLRRVDSSVWWDEERKVAKKERGKPQNNYLNNSSREKWIEIKSNDAIKKNLQAKKEGI